MYRILLMLAFSLCAWGCSTPSIKLQNPETGLTTECSGEGWTAGDCEYCARAFEQIGYVRIASSGGRK